MAGVVTGGVCALCWLFLTLLVVATWELVDILFVTLFSFFSWRERQIEMEK